MSLRGKDAWVRYAYAARITSTTCHKSQWQNKLYISTDHISAFALFLKSYVPDAHKMRVSAINKNPHSIVKGKYVTE